MQHTTLNKLYFATLPLLFVLLTFAFIGVPRMSTAQVRVHVNAPPAASTHLEALWHVQLNNLGAKREIRLYGTARIHTGRLVASGLSATFTIPPGQSIVNPSDISPIDYTSDQGYESAMKPTGKVPADQYSLCIFAIDTKTKDTLGFDCVNHHVVVNVTPPQLVSPANNSSLTVSLPHFTWTPISPATSAIKITYRLKIVEVIGRQSAVDAMKSNPAWFEEDNIASTVFPYQLSATPFENGSQYAWQIIAYGKSPDGQQGELVRSKTFNFKTTTTREK